jgi:hypothetical protein
MSLSLWKERFKLGILFFAYIVCLCTLFTSESTSLGIERSTADLPPLRVPPVCDRFCDAGGTTTFTKDGTNTKQQNDTPQDESCRTCQSTLKRVEKQLNINPRCLWAEQQVMLCEVEWCISGGNDDRYHSPPLSTAQECRTECQQVRTNLKGCIDDAIQTAMQKVGLSIGS